MLLINWCVTGLASLGGAAAAPAVPAIVALASQDAKAEFEKKYAEVGGADCKDANALFQVALWAEQNNLKTDSKRLLRQVIKIDTDHAEARALLGYEKFEGKWLTKREIEREKAKKEEADKAALGLKKWKGEWVPAADYEKLEKGLVKVEVEGQTKWVTPVEKERIDKGMTLFDGMWVTPEALEHLKKGEFPVGDKWLSESEADKVHSDFSSPWEMEGELCTLVTTCKYKFAKTALLHADESVRQAYKILSLEMPKDAPKIGLIMVKDRADYTNLGQPVSDPNDASMSSEWSTFILSDQQTGRLVAVTIYEVLQEGNDTGNDIFSLGHVRFAAAFAALRNLPLAEPTPLWFNLGLACYCERYWQAFAPAQQIVGLQKWSLDSLNREGGLLQLKPMFDAFEVKRHTILQAGLLVSYLQNAQLTPKIDEQWKKCKEALKAPKQKDLEKTFVKLEVLLSKEGDKELDAYATSVRG
jgi:hypothetical protein